LREPTQRYSSHSMSLPFHLSISRFACVIRMWFVVLGVCLLVDVLLRLRGGGSVYVLFVCIMWVMLEREGGVGVRWMLSSWQCVSGIVGICTICYLSHGQNLWSVTLDYRCYPAVWQCEGNKNAVSTFVRNVNFNFVTTRDPKGLDETEVDGTGLIVLEYDGCLLSI